ncbi:hypothetical protein [Bacillus sp. FSL K6-0067]|uniref:hypothetical protein n=1 Tax=Bacillus sp. FSL K6-0067 TaxID=2921412 RepID=UPI00077A0E27|nr:hypothetical protein [Bacillus cereus]KXY24830.1 hypothetical protein AT267_27295 [Bacillus cereus]
MLKKKMIKVALCSAIATGVVGSFEAMKSSQVSAASYNTVEIGQKIDEKIKSKLQGTNKARYTVGDLRSADGKKSYKYIYNYGGSTINFKVKKVDGKLLTSANQSASLSDEDKTVYEKVTNSKLGFDTSVNLSSDSVLDWLQKLLNLGGNAKLGGNVKGYGSFDYTQSNNDSTSYKRTFSVDATVKGESGKIIVPVVFTTYLNQSYQQQQINPEFINYWYDVYSTGKIPLNKQEPQMLLGAEKTIQQNIPSNVDLYGLDFNNSLTQKIKNGQVKELTMEQLNNITAK